MGRADSVPDVVNVLAGTTRGHWHVFVFDDASRAEAAAAIGSAFRAGALSPDVTVAMLDRILAAGECDN